MRRTASFALVVTSLFTLGGAGALAAQQQTPAQAAPQQAAPQQPRPTHPILLGAPPARPEDVSSIDAIVKALYDVISGDSGQARDWNRMRSLFVPGGKLMPLGRRPDGSTGLRVMEVNDYIALSGPQLEAVGFREREIARRTEQFGHMAHVFSTYEGTLTTRNQTIRGINSIQLMNDGTRWWVMNVFWEAESPTLQLPPEYLTTPPPTVRAQP